MQQSIDTCSLLLPKNSSFIDFSLFFLNRYHNMGNLLKVLTCTDLEQEPNFFLDFESEFFRKVIAPTPDIDHMNIFP